MKYKVILLLLVSSVLCGLFVRAYGMRNTTDKLKKIPEGLSLKASFDKKSYFIGENVLVHFVVSNKNSKPFKIEMGGDYRGSPRYIRFKVKVIDKATGKACDDPHPNPMCFGGIGSTFEVIGKKSFTQSLPLLRYARINKPGIYKVSIKHDFGWDIKESSMPSAVGEVEFKKPNKKQAQAVIEAAMNLPEDHGYSMGSKRGDYLDFTIISDPVYLDILLPYARLGNEDCIRGIGNIEDPSSTRALIELANSKNKKVSRLAAQLICARLPDPQWEGKLPARCPFNVGCSLELKYLSERSWKPDFQEAVRKIATRFINKPEKEDIVAGAFIFECIGKLEDIQTVKAALDRQLEVIKNQKLEKGIYPRPRGAMQELMRAATILIARGAEFSDQPESPGEVALYLEALNSKKEFKPGNALSVLSKAATSSYPYLRELAFLNASVKMEPELRKHLINGIKDKDPDVSIAAMKLAEKSCDKKVLSAVLDSTHKANEEWQLRQAVGTAFKLGGYLDALLSLANRLDDSNVANHCFTLLIEVFDSKTYHGYGSSNMNFESEGASLKNSWSSFLKNNSFAIKNSKRVALDVKKVPSSLFPKGFQFHLVSGEDWPAK